MFVSRPSDPQEVRDELLLRRLGEARDKRHLSTAHQSVDARVVSGRFRGSLIWMFAHVSRQQN